MTAINIIRQQHRISILTDTALYDREGVVHAFGQKAATIPHLKVAIATRGAAILPGLMAACLGMRFATFDALVEDGGPAVESLYNEFFALISGGGETELDLYIAGWSEARKQPEVYELYSEFSPSLDGRTAWTFYPLEDGAFIMAPDPEELADHVFRPGWTVERLDPISDGLAIMEAQRQFTGGATSHEDGNLHLIGGAAVLTEIKEDGITQRVIRRWNDQIGEKINPEPAAVPETVVHLSRQQRRAMERAQRAIQA